MCDINCADSWHSPLLKWVRGEVFEACWVSGIPCHGGALPSSFLDSGCSSPSGHSLAVAERQKYPFTVCLLREIVLKIKSISLL